MLRRTSTLSSQERLLCQRFPQTPFCTSSLSLDIGCTLTATIWVVAHLDIRTSGPSATAAISDGRCNQEETPLWSSCIEMPPPGGS